jgi:hypothetical protein
MPPYCGLSVARDLAQQSEQFAVRVQRLVLFAFDSRLPCELAQLLAIGIRKPGEQFAERLVAFVDQAIAPGFELMQAAVSRRARPRSRSSAARIASISPSSSLRICLARNCVWRLCAICCLTPRAFRISSQVVGQRHCLELRVGQRNQRVRQLQHVERLAPALAAADFEASSPCRRSRLAIDSSREDAYQR